MSRPAVFFDRDGVVNTSPGPGYVLRWEDFHFAPGIFDALAVCTARGHALVLVTSQQGVGKGYMTQDTLDGIHARMQEELSRRGAAFESIQVCPHLDGTCTCRKPGPGMILRARDALDLNLASSWVVGDSERDIVMAANAGVPNTIRIGSPAPGETGATLTLGSVVELAAALRDLLPAPSAA